MNEDTDERILLAKKQTLLANERTFLSWTRTGLACVGGGLAIIRFLTFQNSSHQLLAQLMGSVLVLLGVSIFTLSLFDYMDSYKKLQIKNGYAGSVWTISTITFILITVSLLLLLIAFKFAEPSPAR